jgi:hypothetical protein
MGCVLSSDIEPVRHVRHVLYTLLFCTFLTTTAAGETATAPRQQGMKSHFAGLSICVITPRLTRVSTCGVCSSSGEDVLTTGRTTAPDSSERLGYSSRSGASSCAFEATLCCPSKADLPVGVRPDEIRKLASWRGFAGSPIRWRVFYCMPASSFSFPRAFLSCKTKTHTISAGKDGTSDFSMSHPKTYLDRLQKYLLGSVRDTTAPWTTWRIDTTDNSRCS